MSNKELKLLKVAHNEQAAAKVGIFGEPGSGKTTTAGLLALGISLTYCDGAPVAMMDTEQSSDFLLPIFRAEGVDLLVLKSRAFADMVKVLSEAEGAGCSAFIVDSVSHTWVELQEAYKRKLNVRRLEFHHWMPIKAEWQRWTNAYLTSPLHCIVNGRAGYEYEYQENENTGKKELIKGDSKMRAEGQFGYEPSLLVEMERIREDTKGNKGGRFTHNAHVLKDRSWALNGKVVTFRDRDSYAKGGWREVFDAFEPHFASLEIGGRQQAGSDSSSVGLFDADTGSAYYRQRKQREVALEEIQGSFVLLWPGQDAKSKRIKMLVLDTIFGTRSWAAVSDMRLADVELGLDIIRRVEARQKTEQVSEEGEIIALVNACCQAASEYEPAKAEDDDPFTVDNTQSSKPAA